MASKHRRIAWGVTISLAVGAAVSAGFVAGAFRRVEWATYDARVALVRASREPSPEVAVVLVDEASLRAMNAVVGRWPWPRSVFADVIEFLSLGQPAAVVLDVLFTEHEQGRRTSPGGLGPNDTRLAEATREGRVVYHAAQILRDEEDEYNRRLLHRPLPEGFDGRFGVHVRGEAGPPRTAICNNFYLPIPEVYRYAKGVGAVDLDADSDGVFRRAVLLRSCNGQWVPGLGLAPVLQRLSTRSVVLSPGGANIGRVSVPLAEDDTYLVNLYGGFRPYSMSGLLTSIQKLKQGDVEHLIVNPEEFRGKIVFVGASAVGVEEARVTPVSNHTPGVMIHASIASNLLLGDFLRQISATTGFLLIFGMAATTAAGVLVFPRLLFQMAIPPLLSLGYVLWAFGAFRGNVVYPVVPPVAAVLLSWFLSLAYHGFTEGKDRRRVRRMLSQYVSPAVLAEVLDHYAEHLQAEVGRKERVTILFSDIRDFTSLSERMEARSVVEMLNVYFSEMTEAIFSEGGTIDKFIGDAIMCFWGAPVRVEDHAGRAVRAALSMLQRLDRVNAALEAKQYPRLRIGIGIHTGEVVLGNIGSEKKLDYTAIGDGVNLASRLEGLTKTYGSPILLSEDTFRELNGATPCAVVDLVRVKGKNVPVRLYRPLLGKDASEEERKEAHGLAEAAETAFRLYLGRRWKEAYDAYRRLPPHRTTEILIARCHTHLAEEPPEAWDGVHTLQQK